MTLQLTVLQVQATAERERRWFSLATSVGFALILWFAGAAIFMRTERSQEWSYFTSLYFSFVALLTIGYGGKCARMNTTIVIG